MQRTNISRLLRRLAISFAMGAVMAWPQPSRAQPFVEEEALSPSDVMAAGFFGWSVSISGDTALVGSPFTDDPAFLFERIGGQWILMARLSPSDPDNSDQFGFSVSISDDTALVGARRGDDACPMNPNCDSGSAYIFVRPPGGWTDMTQTAKLTASDAEEGDEFGSSVSIDGDTALVGAPSGPLGDNLGSAYVFVRPTGGWTDMTETAMLTPVDVGLGDHFGASASIDGGTAVVGAPFDDDAGESSGSAYVFVEPPGGWASMPTMTQTAKLLASDHAAGDEFGTAVSISGDTALIGARLDDDGGDATGSAYVFVEPAGGWSNSNEMAKLTASDAATGDRFGTSVSLFENVAAIGAPLELSAGTSGAAYVFVMPAGGWTDMTEMSMVSASDAAPGDQFGFSVSLCGETLIVGKERTGACFFQSDRDGDGTFDRDDGCADDANKTAPGICGCGTSDVDDDGDGTPNCFDPCPNDPTKLDPGVCGCGNPDIDTNGDGIIDCPNPPAGQTTGDCGIGMCATGMGMAMPMMLLGLGWMRWRRL